MDTDRPSSRTGLFSREFLLSSALLLGGQGISSDLNANYTEDELDYLDRKLEEWAFDKYAGEQDFVTWMNDGNDPLKVLEHLKEDE